MFIIALLNIGVKYSRLKINVFDVFANIKLNIIILTF